jgi:hypothetical protein
VSLAALLVLINGAIVAGAPPPRLLFGHVVAPLVPILTRVADRVRLDGDAITVVRGDTTCELRIGSHAMACNGAPHALPVAPFARADVVFVPLADVATAFGGSIAFDARRRIVAIEMPARTALQTPQPFDPNAPQVAPTEVFTPAPPPATRPPLESASPQPRRTAIPAIPSRVPGS